MSSTQELQYPDYVLGCVAGLIAAFVLMPVHQLFVAMSFSNGTYNTWGLAAFVAFICVGLAVRLGAKMGGDIPLAVIAAFITLIHVIGGEYWVANTLLNKYGAEMGYDPVPLLLPLSDMIEIFGVYIQNDPGVVIFMIFGPVMAVVVAMMRDLGAVPRYAVASPAPQAAPATFSASTPIRVTAIPADAFKLGEPSRIYQSGIAASALVAVILGAIGVLMVTVAYTTFSGSFVFVAMGLAFIGLAIYRIFPAVANLDKQVVILKDGVSITHKGVTRTMRWAEISKVWQKQTKLSVYFIPMVDIHEYTLEGVDGSKMTIGNTFPKIGEIGAIIQQEVTKVKLPQALEALNRGETLIFGPVEFSRDAIKAGSSVLAWSDVRDVGTWQGTVRVRRKTGLGLTASGPSHASIPNLHLFYTLVYGILKQPQSM